MFSPPSPCLMSLLERSPFKFLAETYPAKNQRDWTTVQWKLHNPIIIMSTIFGWSTGVTDRPADKWTTAYSMLSIYDICCCTLKRMTKAHCMVYLVGIYCISKNNIIKKYTNKSSQMFMRRQCRRSPTGCKGWWMWLLKLSVILVNMIVDWRKYQMTSSTGWMSIRGLNTNSVSWCTGVCMNEQPGTSLITSSQPLMLLLAVFVYDPLTWIVCSLLPT